MKQDTPKSLSSTWTRPQLKVVGTLRDVRQIVQRPGADSKNNHGS